MSRAARFENRTDFDSVARRAARSALGVSNTIQSHAFDLKRAARRAPRAV
jgi:hypothetical protein